jgi:hypothetical protein
LGKLKETLLDILNNDIGKMEIAWIIEAIIKKMEERRKAKTTNIKEYRRLEKLTELEKYIVKRYGT